MTSLELGVEDIVLTDMFLGKCTRRLHTKRSLCSSTCHYQFVSNRRPEFGYSMESARLRLALRPREIFPSVRSSIDQCRASVESSQPNLARFCTPDT